jgi:hypothetical protein
MATMEGWNIPYDLIFNEILIRLPLKSLLRFRCVCKAWQCAISNRHLIESHRHHSRSKVHIMRGVYNIRDGGVSIIINIGCLNEEGQLQYYFRLPALKHFAHINSSRDLIVLIYVDGYILSNPVINARLSLSPPSYFLG